MKAIDLKEPKEREYCNCPARHTKGSCDSDFPPNTYSLPLTDRQLEMQIAARTQFGSLSVTERMLYTDKTHRRCNQCRAVYKPERSTSQFCSDACRVRHSRDLT